MPNKVGVDTSVLLVGAGDVGEGSGLSLAIPKLLPYGDW